MNQDVSSADDERYLEHRKRLYDLAVEQTNKFDRLIMSLSGGALVLSVTFLKEISPRPESDTTHWLAMGWAVLIISMLSTLASHHTSQRDMLFEVRRLDKLYEAGESHDGSSNIWNKITNILNVFSMICFVVGISFISAYAYLNLP